MTYTMRDLDNRCDDGPFEIKTEEVEVVVAYLDGALRSDLSDPEIGGPDIDEAIACLRAGDIDQANALVSHMSVSIAASDVEIRRQP